MGPKTTLTAAFSTIGLFSLHNFPRPVGTYLIREIYRFCILSGFSGFPTAFDILRLKKSPRPPKNHPRTLSIFAFSDNFSFSLLKLVKSSISDSATRQSRHSRQWKKYRVPDRSSPHGGKSARARAVKALPQYN